MIPRTVRDRRELEGTWRNRFEDAHRRYSAATEVYRRLLGESPEGLPPAPHSELARAREAESEALAELTRVRQIFTELTVHNRLPEEQLPPRLVAVIDDDESIRDSVRALLRSAGYAVAVFESAEAFLESAASMHAGCLILDFRMPGMSGLDLQLRLNSSNSRVPIILITAHDDTAYRERAIRAGAVDILHKPFAPATLLSTLQAVLGPGGEPDR